MIKYLKNIFLIAMTLTFTQACTAKKAKTEHHKIVSFPSEIDKSCRNGRAKIYDECSNQTDLFNAAQARTIKEDKTLLVSYGAEWCIWCHVFNAYIKGEVDKFTYTYGEPGKTKRWTDTLYERAKRDVTKEANALNTYVSENFVIVHIDYEHASGSDDVLNQSGAHAKFNGSLPYIFTVDKTGDFAAVFKSKNAEIRRDTIDWYRGYDRVRLLRELTSLREAAIE